MRKQHPNALAKCMCGRRPHLTRPFLAPCSGWPPVRKVRRQVPRLRLLRAAVRPRAYLRRVQLRLLSGSLRHLWPAGHLRCLLLQGVHAAGEGRTWRPAPTPTPARIHPRASRLPYSRIVCERASARACLCGCSAMAVQRSSTWARRRQTSFTSAKSTASARGNGGGRGGAHRLRAASRGRERAAPGWHREKEALSLPAN